MGTQALGGWAERALATVGVLLCAVAGAFLLGPSAARALVPAGDGWYWQNPQPARIGEIEEVEFAGPNDIWALGMGHGLGHSTDGGATWVVLPGPDDTGFISMSFADPHNGWILSWPLSGKANLRHTSNGGATWDEIPLPDTMRAGDIAFADGAHGYATGRAVDPGSYEGPASFFWTVDGGVTWQNRVLPVDAGALELQFVDAQRGWMLLGDGRVGRTIDGGRSWTYAQALVAGRYERWDTPRMQFIDGSNGIASCGIKRWEGSEDAAVATTSDGGATWRAVGLPPSVALAGIAMVDAQRLVALGAAEGTAAGVCLTSDDCGATWQRRNMSPANSVTTVVAGPAGLLCAFGRQAILTSADGGATWQPRSGGFIDTLLDVEAIDQEVWAAAWKLDVDSPFFLDFLQTILEHCGWRPSAGALLHTVDGVTWREERVPDGVVFSSLAFATHAKGWALGAKGFEPEDACESLYVTSDGGSTWGEQLSFDEADFTGLCAVDADHAWVARGASILRTTDGGRTWGKSRVSKGAVIDDLQFLDAQNGWAAGKDGRDRIALYHSADGGQTWQRQALPATGDWITSMSFADVEHGWLLILGEDEHVLLRTSDGGAGWEAIRMPQGMNVGAVECTTPLSGWCVGDSVYRTTDGGLTWVDQTTGTAGPQEDGALHDVTESAAGVWAVGGGGTIISNIDTTADTAPPSTFDDFDRDWHRQDVTVSLTAGDQGGSGLVRTEYRVDGASEWRAGNVVFFGAPATGIGDGRHYIAYRSVDNAGNVESATTRRVSIDTQEPYVSGERVPASVMRGQKVRLRFRVRDALSPEAYVRISIWSSRGKLVKRLYWMNAKTGVVKRVTFKAPGKRGVYYVAIRALDLARNEAWGGTELRVGLPAEVAWPAPAGAARPYLHRR